MPIRIRCDDQLHDWRQAIESKGITKPSLGNPRASYTDSKAEFQILHGSI